MAECCGIEASYRGFDKYSKGKWEFWKCLICDHYFKRKVKLMDNKITDGIIDGIVNRKTNKIQT